MVTPLPGAEPVRIVGGAWGGVVVDRAVTVRGQLLARRGVTEYQLVRLELFELFFWGCRVGSLGQLRWVGAAAAVNALLLLGHPCFSSTLGDFREWRLDALSRVGQAVSGFLALDSNPQRDLRLSNYCLSVPTVSCG